MTAKSRLAMLWLILALLFQGFVTQTHVHTGVDRTGAATASALAAVPVAETQKRGPALPACLLCEEQALFGAYLLTDSMTLAAPPAVIHNYVADTLPLFTLNTASHAWRSRAPPIALT